MKKFRIGVIGFAHMHINSLVKCFADLGDKVEWAGCSDVKPLIPSISDKPSTRSYNMKNCMKITGMTRVYDDYAKLLDEGNLDIAIVCCENAFHGKVVSDVLLRGVNVVVEKPMATSMPDALLMAHAAKHGGAVLAVNWPSTWSPGIRLAHKLVSEGAVGKVFKFTYRNTDSLGPFSYGEGLSEEEMASEWWYHAKAGGGAFWDYCCYGSCLASWFIGSPVRSAYGVRANFNSPFGNAEDYGTITALFDDAVALIEGSWTTVNTGIPNGPIVFGLKGTLVTEGDEVRIYKDRRSKAPSEVYKAEPLPQDRNNIAKEFISHLENGTPLHPTLNLETNLNAMMILDAGYRSSVSNKLEQAKSCRYAPEKL
ncbi:MAG: Gfo/Idh/MocA family protein [Caldicoprobacterales bacterium]|jgi:predicted dehydrogenase|nr:Gfo/Idh/MocA family oxidoreductase [Clostridiales bacterium]